MTPEQIKEKEEMVETMKKMKKQTTFIYKGVEKPHKKFRTNIGYNKAIDDILSLIQSKEH